MNNEFWHEDDESIDGFDDESELTTPNKKSKSKGRQRKWREIEAIKEQRRLRRDLSVFEQYSL
jgi:hypothetical protein